MIQARSNELTIKYNEYKIRINQLLEEGLKLMDDIRDHEEISKAILSSLVEIQNVELTCAELNDKLTSDLTELKARLSNLAPPRTELDELDEELLAEPQIPVIYILPDCKYETTVSSSMKLSDIESILNEGRGIKLKLNRKYLGDINYIYEIGSNGKKIILQFN